MLVFLPWLLCYSDESCSSDYSGNSWTLFASFAHDYFCLPWLLWFIWLSLLVLFLSLLGPLFFSPRWSVLCLFPGLFPGYGQSQHWDKRASSHRTLLPCVCIWVHPHPAIQQNALLTIILKITGSDTIHFS